MSVLKRLSGYLIPGSLFLFLVSFTAQAQIQVKGTVTDADGGVIQFAYVVNRNTSHGVVTDFDGKFSIAADLKDTLLVSHLGHVTQKIMLKNWKDSVRNGTLELKCILFKNVFKLEPVVVRTYDFTENEKEYYRRIAEVPKPGVGSPVSYFYDKWSHEGKVKRKVQELYSGILMEEIIAGKVNDEVIRRITGDEKMTLEAMRKICFLSDHFLLSANEYDIYKRIKDCYINRP